MKHRRTEGIDHTDRAMSDRIHNRLDLLLTSKAVTEQHTSVDQVDRAPTGEESSMTEVEVSGVGNNAAIASSSEGLGQELKL